MCTPRTALLFALLATAICLDGDSLSYSQAPDNPPPTEAAEDAPQAQAARKFPAHGYTNDANSLLEGWIPVTDQYGKRATRFPSKGERDEPLPDVKFEIVWTSPSQYDWNYSVPELHDGKDLFHTRFPSVPLFFERTLSVSDDKMLAVSIPDTPYSFYILDGKLSPYFRDNQKDVVWRLNSKDMDTLFARMKSISVSPHKLELTAPGGDMAEFLSVDFTNRNKSPAISTWRRFDGP